jgi:dTDP-L-rhamnose 4-epimerase
MTERGEILEAPTAFPRAISDSSKPLVLITGGAGFIGSHTADALVQKGYRVRILDCLDPQVHGAADAFSSYLHPEIECIRGDVRHAADVRRALKGVSVVYHFAALTGVGQSMYDMKNYTDVNISGTANLLEMIVKHKFPIKIFVLSSSRAVYGEGTHECPSCGIVYPPIRNRGDMEHNRFEVFCPTCGQKTTSVATSEDRPLLPVSVYGLTKKFQEELCQYAAKTFGLPVVILRYFNVYGSRQSLINPYTGILSIFFIRLLAAKTISIYEHGIPLRDFVHVLDVVQANLKALDGNLPPGTVLNVGTGVETSIFDVGRALARAVGKEPQFEDQGEFRVGDIHACVADLGKTKKLLRYKPKISLEEGMQEFVAWARVQQTVDLYQKTVEELKTFGLFSQIQTEVKKN